MASKGQTKRKDKDRIVLKAGESQRKNGSYQYRWSDHSGKIKSGKMFSYQIKEAADQSCKWSAACSAYSG